MGQFDYDLFTIGAGSGGVSGTRTAGSFGAKTAICEDRRIGGTCVLRGCVPKKLLVYASHFAEAFEDAEGYGWTVEGASLDWGKLIKAKNKDVDRLHAIYIRLLRDAKVDIHEGRGTIVDPHTVEVGGERFTAERIMIATGAHPWLPDIPGIEHAITSDDALDLEHLPRRITIVGGGYIGVEFAGIFAAVGVETTLVVRGDTVLRGFDEDIRVVLCEEMGKRGVKVKTETNIVSIEHRDGQCHLLYEHGEMDTTDLVLYATGRRPNSANLGLEALGIELGTIGEIPVNEYSQTSVPSILAVGDVTDRATLTPVAIAEARAVAQTFFNDNPVAVSHKNIPTAVFSNPPVGTVGLTEREARAQYGKVDVYRSRFKPMKFTLAGRDSRTLMKLIVDPKTDVVLGCHMVGEDSAEIIQGFGVAVAAGLTKKAFDRTIGIHPTSAEEFVTMRVKVPDHGH